MVNGMALNPLEGNEAPTVTGGFVAAAVSMQPGPEVQRSRASTGPGPELIGGHGPQNLYEQMKSATIVCGELMVKVHGEPVA